MSETELLPCPFCGRPGEIHLSGDPNMLHVGCLGDDPDICYYGPMTITTKAELEEAIDAWNRRAKQVSAIPAAVYQDLSWALNVLEEECGKSTRIDTARAWLRKHARQPRADDSELLPLEVRTAIEEALDLASEAGPYAGEYFDKKWDLSNRFQASYAVLRPWLDAWLQPGSTAGESEASNA